MAEDVDKRRPVMTDLARGGGVSSVVARRLVERTGEAFALPAAFEPTPLQHLQRDLVDVVRRVRESDERTARAFHDYLFELAAREAARGR
jgi:hypothetical protein